MNNNPQGQIFHIEKNYKWSDERDELLISLAKSNRRNNWKFISQNIKKTSPEECMRRFKIIRTDIKRGYWSFEEDEQLLKLYHLIGPSWAKIAQIMRTREGKQVRDRYINIVGENLLKDKFSKEEDLKLYLLQKYRGNKWTMFTGFLKGRSPDNLKNRFNSGIKYKSDFFESMMKKEGDKIKNILNEFGFGSGGLDTFLQQQHNNNLSLGKTFDCTEKMNFCQKIELDQNSVENFDSGKIERPYHTESYSDNDESYNEDFFQQEQGEEINYNNDLNKDFNYKDDVRLNEKEVDFLKENSIHKINEEDNILMNFNNKWEL
jgi:hypothetical protein